MASLPEPRRAAAGAPIHRKVAPSVVPTATIASPSDVETELMAAMASGPSPPTAIESSGPRVRRSKHWIQPSERPNGRKAVCGRCVGFSGDAAPGGSDDQIPHELSAGLRERCALGDRSRRRIEYEHLDIRLAEILAARNAKTSLGP